MLEKKTHKAAANAVSLSPKADPQPVTPGGLSFLPLLEKQRDLYAALLEMGREQRDLIARNETEALLTLLGRRQEAVDQLTRIDAALNQCRNDWPAHYQALGTQNRERVDRLVRDIQEMLGAVMDMDRADVETLAEQKDRVGNELARLPTHRQVNAAYGVPAARTSRYMDQTDEAG